MNRIKLAALAGFALCAALALPAAAPATLTEVGVIGTTTPATVPSCPGSPCYAVSRTTGFQVKVGSVRNPLSVPRAGTIVAWEITLAKPTAAQINYFNSKEGGPAEAGLAILEPQPKPALTYKLAYESPAVKLQQYFGESAQFPLESTVPVKKGDVIALNVPTWAPSLALGFGANTSWRASRSKKQCKETSSPTNQTLLGSAAQYYCLYQTARLTYSATLISTP